MCTRSHTPLARALCSLEGLSVGDTFGQRFVVHPDTVDHLIATRALPAPPWRFTDDTPDGALDRGGRAASRADPLSMLSNLVVSSAGS